MKITLTKNISLRVAIVYMKIKKDVLRTDIREYLNGKHFENSLINNRINEYFKEIKIYDEAMHLTKKGETVKNTGYLPTYEEGKYKIWFTQEDDYFGNDIMYFRREMPNEKSSLEPLDIVFDDENYQQLPVIEKEEEIGCTNFSLVDKNLIGKYLKNTENISVTIILERGKQTYCTFSGKLGKDNSTELNSKKTLDLDENFEDVITEILPNFDSNYNRLKVSFKPENINFKINNYKCEWMGFSGYIDNIDLMPIDKQNAIEWRNYILKEEISKKYLSPNDFASKVYEINEKPAFEKYRNELDIPASKDFKTETKLEFWHLNAPIDLNPNTQETNINEVISLGRNEKISFAELVHKLGTNADNDLVIYYDQYVGKEFQQKAAAAFMESINGSKKIILTDLSPEKQKSII